MTPRSDWRDVLLGCVAYALLATLAVWGHATLF